MSSISNLNLKYLLSKLKENSQEILGRIDDDPLLTKRTCTKTGLTIANASKELFSPTQEHQLYAKGIVYKKTISDIGSGFDLNYDFALVGLPYLKIYNLDESAIAVNHVIGLELAGYTPVFSKKLDGTMISRNVVDGQIIFSTRGIMETMVEPGDLNQFFTWTRKICQEKYPVLLDPEYLSACTSIFELIGPENRIITIYPDWDLIWTGTFCKTQYLYWTNKTMNEFASEYGGNPVGIYNLNASQGLTAKVQKLNEVLKETDHEGSVIQFEGHDNFGFDLDQVFGRIKAKTDTYRSLLRIMNNCNYDTIAEMIEKSASHFTTWDNFKRHLESLGNTQFPEELMESYKKFCMEHLEHRKRCEYFIKDVNKEACRIMDSGGIKWSYSETDQPTSMSLDKANRAKFAQAVKSKVESSAYFAWLDGKLDLKFVMTKIFKTPEEST